MSIEKTSMKDEKMWQLSDASSEVDERVEKEEFRLIDKTGDKVEHTIFNADGKMRGLSARISQSRPSLILKARPSAYLELLEDF